MRKNSLTKRGGKKHRKKKKVTTLLRSNSLRKKVEVNEYLSTEENDFGTDSEEEESEPDLK